MTKIVLTIISTILLADLTLAQDNSPFVLVELFTSEGCSSCPPADRLLSEIVDEDNATVDVLALSFHVDYWDYIGWKDPYADQRFTQRQRSYARKLYSNQVYTPQMVVNGQYEFVGSNRSKWNALFSKLKNKEKSYAIEINEIASLGNELVIKVSSTNSQRVKLNLAIVERGLSQHVTRGENRGRRLFHDNVVRSYATRQFDGRTNQFKLAVPSSLDIKKSSLIVYAQLESTWEIVGAEKISLSSF